MREIVIDTETTGLSVEEGHRLVEIGCVELENTRITGETAQWYVNPQRSVPEQAVAIHGLNDAFLSDQPLFSDIVDAFLEFLGDGRLVIHNAAFDLAFLNMELNAIGRPIIDSSQVVDTLKIARKKYPQASLDALCRRFSISLEEREKHGALTDAHLLGQVYPYLLGHKMQKGLDLAQQSAGTEPIRDYSQRSPRTYSCNPKEKQAHDQMLKAIENPIWKKK